MSVNNYLNTYMDNNFLITNKRFNNLKNNGNIKLKNENTQKAKNKIYEKQNNNNNNSKP